MNQYDLDIRLVPRSSRRSTSAAEPYTAATAGFTTTSTIGVEGEHTHDNLGLLNKLAADEQNYVYIVQPRETTQGEVTTITIEREKIRAGYADNAETAKKAEQAETAKKAEKATEAERAKMADDLATNSPANQRFLSRKKVDTAEGHITFADGMTSEQESLLNGGAKFGKYQRGALGRGGRIDRDGNAELQSLSIRQFLEVPELRYNRTSVHIGAAFNSPAAGIVREVQQLTSTTGRVVLKLEDGELGSVEQGDLLMGIFHATTEQGGATADTDDGRLNLTFAGFRTVYFECTSIAADRKSFVYALRQGSTAHPSPHMTFASRGNRTKAERQNFVVATRSYTRYMVGVNSWDILPTHIVTQLGDLSSLGDETMTGNGLYSQNAYLTGRIMVKGKNKPVEEVVSDIEQQITDTAAYDQFSPDGSTWHEPPMLSTDRFVRHRRGNEPWGEAVRFVGQDGQSSYTHIRYSNDGNSFTPESAEALEKAIQARGEGVNLVRKLNDPRNGWSRPWKTNLYTTFQFLTPEQLPQGCTEGCCVEQPGYNKGIYHNSMVGTSWPYKILLEQGKIYTMSLWARSDIETTLDFGLEHAKKSVTLSTEWTFYQYSIRMSVTRPDNFVLFGLHRGTAKYYYADIKLEEGTIPTPWQPSPIDAAIGTTAGRWRGEMVSDSPLASTEFSDYTWALVKGDKGDKGEQGIQGIQGAKGEQGIQGAKGADGKSSYTHIAYADNAQGGGFSQQPAGKAYMGMYVDNTPTDSTNPAAYKWSLIKGADGAQGLQGAKGADGRTPYLHIAYASSADGRTNFHVSDPAGRSYIGTYTDYTQADSTDPTKYTWALVKGEKGDKGDQGIQGIQGLQGAKGEQGIQGAKGADGKSSYTHIAYADNAQGGGFSQQPAGKAYMGMYVDSIPTDSQDSKAYKWSLIKGADGANGLQGQKGEDGRTPYFHTAYASSADGRTNFHLSDPTGRTYIGTYTDYVEEDSSEPTKYKWVLMKGEDGHSSYTHIRYSNDGVNFTAASTEALSKAESEGDWRGRNLLYVYDGIFVKTMKPMGGVNQAIRIGWLSKFCEKYKSMKLMRISFKIVFSGCVFASNSFIQFQGNGLNYGWGPSGELNIKQNGEYRIRIVAPVVFSGDYFNTSTKIDLRVDYISQGTITISEAMVEFVENENDAISPYSPSPEDAAIGTTAGRWRGEMVSDSPIASTDFSVYTWVDTKGEKGDTGRSVTSMKTQFALSSSNTNAPTGGWVDVAPNWEPNTYLWTRIHTIYSDGSTSATNAVLDNAWDTKKMLSFSDDNLLLAADFRGAPISNQSYPTKLIKLSEDGKSLQQGEQVTIVVKGSISLTGRNFMLFNSGGWVNVGYLKYMGDGLHYLTTTWKITIDAHTAQNTHIDLYVYGNGGATKADVTIEWVKLVRGTHTSLQYTPSQEELKKSVEAAKARAEDTYTKAAADGIITAAETRAIWRSRAEALRTQADYDRARLSAEYAKIRPQPHIVGSIATELQQKHEQFRGAAAALISACQSAINHAALTEGVYNSLIISSNKKNAYDSAMAALIAVLGAAVELGETGGRNFFGFRKGMVLAALNANVATTLEPSMNGIRMRINTAIPAHSSDRILVRLQRLGFERAGNYTASFRVRANRAMAADTLHVNVCDAGLKRFTPSTTEQRVVTTANVTSYYQASSDNYNGFIDFELAAGKTLNAGDVIDIIDLMIERGRTPSDYKMAEEDATYVQRLLEDTLQLEKVDVTSEKGVSMAGRFDACERLANGGKAVRAFMNGLTNGVRPTFAAGVTNFGTPDERYKTAFYHNGSGHIGPIAYTEDGTMYVGEYGKPNESRLFFNPTMIGGVQELIKANDIVVRRLFPTLTIDQTAGSDGSIDFVRTFDNFIEIKPSTNSVLEFDFTVDVLVTDFTPDVDNSWAQVRVFLIGESSFEVCEVYLDKHNGGTRKIKPVKWNIKNPKPGIYSLIVEAGAMNKERIRVHFINPTATDGYAFQQTGINAQPITTINPNGFVSFHDPTKFVAIRDGQLMVRGEIDTDSPVVLASGYVDKDGNLQRGKGRATRAERRSTGEYLIHHTIGHTDYAIVISPIGNGDLLVGQLAASSNNLAWCYIKNIERKNVNGVSTMTNSAFTFAILGRQ